MSSLDLTWGHFPLYSQYSRNNSWFYPNFIYFIIIWLDRNPRIFQITWLIQNFMKIRTPNNLKRSPRMEQWPLLHRWIKNTMSILLHTKRIQIMTAGNDAASRHWRMRIVNYSVVTDMMRPTWVSYVTVRVSYFDPLTTFDCYHFILYHFVNIVWRLIN